MPNLTLVRLAAAAMAVCTLATAPAGAFSQIGTQDGAAPQREGIVSVPLPPLSSPPLAGTSTPAASPPAQAPGAAAQPAGGQAPAGTTGPAAGPSPAATPAASPSPASPPPASTAPGAPAPATDAPVAPNDTTDQGETEAPATDVGPAGPADGTGTPPGASSQGGEDVPPPPIVYGDEGLPKPVKDLRDRLIAIARTGDIEALRPYIQVGDGGTVLSFGESEGDPIAFLKAASGDGEGVEILAIMLEILQAGHVRNEPGADDEIFVWPYFTAVAIDKLTKPQKVELFELVTAGDYQEMLGFGAYNFYRIGISPDGKLQFFVAGD